jgi:ectoine hydroxylase-related dioxygenase (phytanoyl-CoA dioxygenase family)
MSVTTADIDAFNRDGFIRLPALLDPAEVAAAGREITRLTLALNGKPAPMEGRTTYERAFLQVMNLWTRSDAVRRFIAQPALARTAAELLGVAGVRLYHDQSLYKEPGGGITPAHADQYYWPLASDRIVTAWIPLQPVPEDMGPLAFYAGSHRHAVGRDLPISDESEAAIVAGMEAAGFPLVGGGFELGEVSFHLGWTFHKAGPNRSSTPRSVMTAIYMDADMRLKAPANAMEESDRAQWCPGVEVGEIIASPINPQLWP